MHNLKTLPRITADQLGRGVERMDQLRLKPDVVILGGGLVGSILASQLAELSDDVRVLVLEAGQWEGDDHAQSSLSGPSLVDSLEARHWILDSPLDVPGIIEAVGGGSIAWSGWSPTPDTTELEGWPSAVVQELKDLYLEDARSRLRIGSPHSEIQLAQGIRNLISDGDNVGSFDHNTIKLDTATDIRAPIAMAASGHVFSPVRKLAQIAIGAQSQQVQVMAGCRVLSLDMVKERLTGIITDRGRLPVSGQQRVVVALNTVESTRQVLMALPHSRLAGQNLAAHVVTEVMLRVPISSIRKRFELGTLLIRGSAQGRRFHIQIHCGVGPIPSDRTGFLRQKVPGLYGEEILSGTDERHMVVSLIGLGETAPDAENVVVLSETRRDSAGQPLPIVRFAQGLARDPILDAMDDCIDRICTQLSRPGTTFRGPSSNPNEWIAELPKRTSLRLGGRRWTNCVHLSGTLRLGISESTSVTDINASLYGAERVFVGGLSLFPRAGSHNGGLTAAALALRLGKLLVS